MVPETPFPGPPSTPAAAQASPSRNRASRCRSRDAGLMTTASAHDNSVRAGCARASSARSSDLRRIPARNTAAGRISAFQTTYSNVPQNRRLGDDLAHEQMPRLSEVTYSSGIKGGAEGRRRGPVCGPACRIIPAQRALPVRRSVALVQLARTVFRAILLVNGRSHYRPRSRWATTCLDSAPRGRVA
jgi:hypothetical protein